MKTPGKRNAVLLVFAVICLVAATCALAGPGSDGKRDPDKPKEPPDQRMLATLREYMEVSDAEWQALLPHLTQVQELTRELRDLRIAAKAFDLPKSFKLPKEMRPDADSQADQRQGAPNPSSVAVDGVNEKARELGALLQNKSARPADIRTKLSEYRVAHAEADKQLAEELARARAKLKELLTVRQELVCVVSGLLE